MRNAPKAKRALLTNSDGGDNHSRYSEDEIKRQVREADIQLYAIGIFESGYHRQTLTELNGPSLLSQLTELTGGAVPPRRKPHAVSATSPHISAQGHKP